ncbi:MAG: glucose-1-phosphate adenylyltransferase, partial [Planctomycetota bacterium]
FLPPTTIRDATIKQSLVADGCRIGNGAVGENSIVGLRCVIGEGAVIRNSILMGADYYEFEEGGPSGGQPPLGIGAGSRIEGAIVDKNCRIGRNVVIANEAGIEEGPEHDAYQVRGGIPVIVKDAVLPDGWRM